MFTEGKILKSAEVAGLKILLTIDENANPTTFRVQVRQRGIVEKTRVFVDYAEASNLFDSYLQGN